MNSIETMEREIQRALPTAWTRLRRPSNPEGEWWLDAKRDEHMVAIQWSPRRGFGVSASALGESYGEGPEETFDDRGQATARVLQLLRTKSHTVPPLPVVLRELRAMFGVTQEELAGKLGVQQAAVSRLERRSDITLSSLRRFVEALGSQLEINIRMPSGEKVRLSDGSEDKDHRATCAHIEEALPPKAAAPLMDVPVAALPVWLASFERDVRTRWPLVVPRLTLEPDSTGRVASSDAHGCVTLDPRAALGLWSDVSAKIRGRRLPPSPRDSFQLTLRNLLAHEVGHFVDAAALRADSMFSRFDHAELQADAVAGWLAARAGDDPLFGSTLASYLGCCVSDCTHPSPQERSWAYLSGYALGERERAPSVQLLVIRAGDLERSRAFYARFGFALMAERHGDGPLHYSCSLAGTVLEIYPATQQAVAGGLRFGIRLPEPERIVQRLIASDEVPIRPRRLERRRGGDVWIVRDPDGNTVELAAGDSPELRHPKTVFGAKS